MKGSRKRLGRLDSVIECCRELAKVYKEARRGQLDTQEAVRLANILVHLRQSLEISTVELRLAALEETQKGNVLPFRGRIA
jgi:hypothetical protein